MVGLTLYEPKNRGQRDGRGWKPHRGIASGKLSACAQEVGIQLGLRSIMWGIELDVDVERSKPSVERRSNNPPVQLSFAATQWGNGYRLNLPFLVMLRKEVEAVHNVG